MSVDFIAQSQLVLVSISQANTSSQRSDNISYEKAIVLVFNCGSYIPVFDSLTHFSGTSSTTKVPPRKYLPIGLECSQAVQLSSCTVCPPKAWHTSLSKSVASTLGNCLPCFFATNIWKYLIGVTRKYLNLQVEMYIMLQAAGDAFHCPIAISFLLSIALSQYTCLFY